MNAQDFKQHMQEGTFSLSVAVNIGNRRQYITDELRNLNSTSQWKDTIERYRPDRSVLTFFVEDADADQEVKEALEFLADKMDFKGDVVPSREPASNGKNFYWIASERREPLIGEDFDFDA